MAAITLGRRKRHPLVPAQCPSCRGGREINGVECPDCAPGRSRSRSWLVSVADALATPAGRVVGWSTSLPGVCGAAGTVYGAAVIVHSVWHQVPALGVAALAASPFLLALDRRL